jgi:hypothetical protein
VPSAGGDGTGEGRGHVIRRFGARRNAIAGLEGLGDGDAGAEALARGERRRSLDSAESLHRLLPMMSLGRGQPGRRASAEAPRESDGQGEGDDEDMDAGY